MEKLKKAFQKRGTQAEILRAAIDQSPHPVIVLGDFNDTAISYTYKTIIGDLQDAFLTKGWGVGSTFTGPLPYLRIDYVLVDPVFEIADFKVIEKKFSDHYPVSCVIAW